MMALVSFIKVINTYPIFIFLFYFPSIILSQSFISLQLPPKAAGPESLAFEFGTKRFYTGVSDGRILQYNGPRDGFRDFGFTSPNRPLGLAFHYSSNKLYICDAHFGLMVLGSAGKQATQLSVAADGEPYHLCNGLDVYQPSGDVFFTDLSGVYDRRNIQEALRVNDSTGRLLMYDSDSSRVTVLMKNLSGPAGVAVSQDGTYLLVSNFISNNTIKYWLQGPRANTYDTINFQERPDNIKRTVVGDFWRAAANVKQPVKSLVPVGERIDGFGRVSRIVNFEPWYGDRLISEVQEFHGRLYVGSRDVNFVGVYSF